jgi:malic enzyme
VLCDRRGALHRGRTDLSPVEQEIAERTNLRGRSGPLARVLAGAEVFIGVSGGTVPAGAVATMAKGAVIFALANPEPEIPVPSPFDPRVAPAVAAAVAQAACTEGIARRPDAQPRLPQPATGRNRPPVQAPGSGLHTAHAPQALDIIDIYETLRAVLSEKI